MYQRIMVPVDESASSHRALEEAIRLALLANAHLHLVHVIDFASFAWSGAEFIDGSSLQKAIKEKGQQVLDEALAHCHAANVSASHRLIESWDQKIASCLKQESLVFSADLVVMGTHGGTGLMHLLLGSVAEGLLHITDKPMLLIRYDENLERDKA
ncbi:MAG: universal stress protein [Neisseriaceae bacterium]|nr:universal stress protein [Neisseriaceae bacterium]